MARTHEHGTRFQRKASQRCGVYVDLGMHGSKYMEGPGPSGHAAAVGGRNARVSRIGRVKDAAIWATSRPQQGTCNDYACMGRRLYIFGIACLLSFNC